MENQVREGNGLLRAGKRIEKSQIPTERRKWLLRICFQDAQEVMSTVRSTSEVASRRGLLLLQEQRHHTEAKLCLPGCHCPSTSPVALHAEPQGWGWVGVCVTTSPSDAVTTLRGAGLGEPPMVPSRTLGGTKALCDLWVCICRNSGVNSRRAGTDNRNICD